MASVVLPNGSVPQTVHGENHTDVRLEQEERKPSFPDASSPHLALVHPTDAEKHVQFNYNGVSWRGPLSMEDYVQREIHLAKQELTNNSGLTYWTLTDTSVTPDERLALCGCETIKKKALVARNGTVKNVVCHGVASVFCPPPHRRRGYAQRMIKELGERLRSWQAADDSGEEVLFSVLYSDIGKEFYAAFGWQPFRSSHISILPSMPISSIDSLPKARPLFSRDLEELCTIDERLIRESMASSSLAKHKDKVFAAIVPDIQTIRWHIAREDFLSKQLFSRVPDIKGAMVGTEPGKRVWCYWIRTWHTSDLSDPKGNTMHILRLVVEERGLFDWEHDIADEDKRYVPAIAALMAFAREEAKQWNQASVEAWNPNETVVQAAQSLQSDAKVEDRDMESIASLRWYGDTFDNGSTVGQVNWIGNEKYAWC